MVSPSALRFVEDPKTIALHRISTNIFTFLLRFFIVCCTQIRFLCFRDLFCVYFLLKNWTKNCAECISQNETVVSRLLAYERKVPTVFFKSPYIIHQTCTDRFLLSVPSKFCSSPLDIKKKQTAKKKHVTLYLFFIK